MLLHDVACCYGTLSVALSLPLPRQEKAGTSGLAAHHASGIASC